MKLTDRLKVEHGIFLAQLRQLEQMVAVRAPAAALAGAIETIARAELQHSALEDRLLYPALARKVGTDAAPLRTIKADHERIQQQLDAIRAGGPDPEKTSEFVRTLRDHMEREIHEVFVLAERVLPEEELHSMCNWDIQHIFEESGNESLFLERMMPLPKSNPPQP
jgi:hemerythrin-like domain-containing protein